MWRPSIDFNLRFRRLWSLEKLLCRARCHCVPGCTQKAGMQSETDKIANARCIEGPPWDIDVVGINDRSPWGDA